MFEWGDSINNKRSAIDTLKNMGKGFVVGETVGAIPYAGKAIGKTKVGSKFGDVANKAYQRIADTSIGAKMGQGLNKVGDLLMTDVKAFNPNKQVAWHGSAADFDKFDNAYMGTGEGAQMHGLGHYVAKSKDIAEERYRKRLAEREVKNTLDQLWSDIKNNRVPQLQNNEEREVFEYIANELTPTDITPQSLQYFFKDLENPQSKEYAQILMNKFKKNNIGNQGQLYQLRIPKNDVMLREEASFAEQPQAVQNAINDIRRDYLNLPDELSTNKEELWNYFQNKLNPNDEYERETLNGIKKLLNGDKLYSNDTVAINDLNYDDLHKLDAFNTTGRDIYKRLKNQFYNEKYPGQKARDVLLEKGIKGISYNGGIDGEANVIFNPDDIDIVRKYYNQPNLYDYLMNDSILTKDYSKNKEIIDNNVKNLYEYLVSPKEIKKRGGYINLGGNNENLYDKLINMDENIPKYIEKTYIIPATSRHYEGGHTTPAANKLFDKLFAGEKVDRNLLDERMQGYYDAYKSGIYKRVEGKPGRTETRKVLNPEWVNANPYYDAPQYGQDDIDDIIEHFEKSISTDKIGHGYSHYSMSNNAKTAYSKGSKPLSKWTKKDIIDRIDEVIKGYNLPLNIDDYKKMRMSELKNYLKKQGYHHTSKYYNITDFYDLDLYKLLEY